MDARRMLRRLVPLMLLAGLGALLLRRRRARQAPAALLPAAAKPQLLLPPVQAALIAVEDADAADVGVAVAAERIVVPEGAVDVPVIARRAHAERFERAPVDIVTVVDDLLGAAR